MKGSVYWFVPFLFIGCGDGENGHLLNTQLGAADNYGASLVTACNEQASAHLQKKEVDSFGDLKLFFDNGNSTKTTALFPGASNKQRCDEIMSHFSANAISEDGAKIPAGLAFDIDLPFDEGTMELLSSGQKGTARVADVFLSYTDGSLKNSKWQINLRCPKAFLVSRILERNEENGESHFKEYLIEPESQICTFRQSGLPYYFSDHKFITLDVQGEIKFSGSNAELTITNTSWLGML